LIIKNRMSFIITLFWISVVFSPIFKIGAHFRIEQFIFFPLFIFIFLKNKFIIKFNITAELFVVFALLISIVALLSSLLSSFSIGNAGFYFVLNWPAKILLNVMIALVIININKSNSALLYKFSIISIYYCVIVVGLIGILQVAEFRGYIPSVGLNNMLSNIYPYHGTLSEVTLIKTQGLFLKTGGIGRATSTFDGQPILLGDYLAVSMILILPFIKKFTNVIIYIVPMMALFLSLSRGSIVAYIIGFVTYFLLTFLFAKNIKNKIHLLYLFFRIIFFLAIVILIIVQFTPLLQSFFSRIESSLMTLLGTGVVEGRTTKIWPNAIGALNDSGLHGWLFGLSNYAFSTDSQYLWLIVNIGLLGVIIFLSLHFYLIRLSRRYMLQNIKIECQDTKFGCSFIAAIILLLIAYIVHPALQGDRLFSTIIILSIFMDSDINNINKKFIENNISESLDKFKYNIS